MTTRYAMMVLPLMLAACGGGGETANNSGAGDSAVVETAPDNLQNDPGNTVVPIGNAASQAPATPLAALPASYLGRWAMVPNDCDPRQDHAAKGLMTVAADRISFYESRATPGNIRRTAPTTVTVDLGFSGEGQTWRQIATLTLLDDGKTLVREAVGGERSDTPGPQRYSRCPATEGAA